MQLARPYFQAGYLAQAEQLAFALPTTFRNRISAGALLLWGRVKLSLGELDEGLKSLLAAEQLNPGIPGIYTQIGDTYVRFASLGRCEDCLPESDRSR